MSTVDELEELLSATPPYREDERARVLRKKAVVESPETVAEWTFDPSEAPYAPLARRGLLIAFDGEGSYHSRGAHAKLAEYLLARVGVEGTAEDAFLEEAGLFLRVQARKKTVTVLRVGAQNSDYCLADLIVAGLNDLLRAIRADSRLLGLKSTDQGVLIALVPAKAEEAIRTALDSYIDQTDERIRRRVNWPS